jgi:hypothetical protein
MHITVNTLNALDEISIRTAHSEYRFKLTDPIRCRGLITGGMFGEKYLDAVLTGAVTHERQRTRELSTKLEVGDCALFYVALSEGLRFLTTSPIVDLALAGSAAASTRM